MKLNQKYHLRPLEISEDAQWWFLTPLLHLSVGRTVQTVGT